jgi:hypothetical protein
LDTVSDTIDHPEDCCVESAGEGSICGAESENSLFGSSTLVNRIVGFIGSLVVTGAFVFAASSSRLDMSEIAFVILVLKHTALAHFGHIYFRVSIRFGEIGALRLIQSTTATTAASSDALLSPFYLKILVACFLVHFVPHL